MHRFIRGLGVRVGAATIAVVSVVVVVAPTPLRPPASAAPISNAEAISVATAHLSNERAALGLQRSDIAQAVVTDVVAVADAFVVHFQQRLVGLDVAGGVMSVVVGPDGAVLDVGNRFVGGVTVRAAPALPTLSAIGAVAAAAVSLGLVPTRPFQQISVDASPDAAATISTGGVAADPIDVRLVLHPVSATSEARLAFEITIRELSGDDWWLVRVDARTGAELRRFNFNSHASYESFAAPLEAPSAGSTTVVIDPADPIASPWGWHDTNGVAGAEFTVTRGNNVNAYTDVDANNVIDPGSQPNGGASLDFTAPLDLAQPPTAYRDAAVINVFQFTNHLHDMLYAYGFDESSGNFQTNNYGRGGIGDDALLAEAQDGSGVNNANFATPPDGLAPRMQMMIFTNPTPDRDSSLDNGLIAHEYAHGLSNRLTGGPSNVTCLANVESASEGWSDYLGIMTTLEAGDHGTDPRTIGTYPLGQPLSGPGLRDAPYSTDMVIDTRTYDTIKTAAIPHGVGAVFASMLWDMTWSFIERDGFTPDWIGGTGGNVTALQLVIDGLKLQPCGPGFVDARNAILLADQVRNAGANQCLIWAAFARRGLGESASQGSPSSRTDGTQAFDVPNSCLALVLTTTATPAVVAPGASIVYASTVSNNSGSAIPGVTITAQIPIGTTYVTGSADCGASVGPTTVSFVIPALAPAASLTCSFTVLVDQLPTSNVWFEDDFDIGPYNWAVNHVGGSADWSWTNTGATEMRAVGASLASDQRLATTAAIPISGAAPTLRFRHSFDTQLQSDGGVVEVSTNGTTWADLGPNFVRNGYTNLVSATSNPIGLRPAFTGASDGFVESVVDLSGYVGTSIFVRFRFGSDSSVTSAGWHVDDVRVADEVLLVADAVATSAAGASDATRVVTLVRVAPVSTTGLLRVTTSPPVPSRISVDGVVRHDWGLDWLTVPTGTHQVCWSGVVGFTSPPCQIVVVSGGQTAVVDGVFGQMGLLQVGVAPAGLPSTIFVDGVTRDEYGLFAFVEPGAHTICWGDVPGGFQAPACTTLTVNAGLTTTTTGTFVANPNPTPGPAPPLGPAGFLRVTTNPAVPARILVDGIARSDWGLTWVKTPIGTHQVCFSDVPGFVTPPCSTIDVTLGATTTVDASFVSLGLLKVEIAPAGLPVDVVVDGVPRNQFGAFMFIEAGVYQVCATSLANWTTPTCQAVAVSAGTLSSATLVFTPL